MSILFISMMHGQAKSDNEIYLSIKYIKSVLWRVAKRLSYEEDARCLKVKGTVYCVYNGYANPAMLDNITFLTVGRDLTDRGY